MISRLGSHGASGPPVRRWPGIFLASRAWSKDKAPSEPVPFCVDVDAIVQVLGRPEERINRPACRVRKANRDQAETCA